MREVALRPPGFAPLVLRLRALTGADEQALNGIGAAAALRLLERLAEGVAVVSLTVSEADRALAGLYDMLYGPKAECRAVCDSCGETYELTLDLDQIMAEQDADLPGAPDAQGIWTMPGGARVRAPRHSDLTGEPQDLAAQLVVGGDADTAAVGAFLERAAPILTLELDACCPQCGEAAQVRFDLAAYLTRRLAGERPFLIRETHLIASRYGWSHSEIMALTRDDRRGYAGLIEAERARLSRRQQA